VTQQAAVRARSVGPVGRYLDSVAVDRGKPFDTLEAMAREFSLSTSPAIGTSIEIDADDFFEPD